MSPETHGSSEMVQISVEAVAPSGVERNGNVGWQTVGRDDGRVRTSLVFIFET